MIPLILVSTKKRKSTTFVHSFIKENQILEEYVFNIEPLTKEYSIDQIRDIKKQVSYASPLKQLYIFHEFDHSSFEVQNAFLKTLEECPINIQFILMVSNQYLLVSTIRSRSKMVVLDQDESVLDNAFEKTMDEFIDKGDMKIMGSSFFSTTSDTKQNETYIQLILYFKKHISKNKQAAPIIREVIKTHALILNNNIGWQIGMDHICMFIRSKFISN